MQTLTRSVPPHVWVAISAWLTRAVVAVVSRAAIRILLQSLGTEQYSVFAILSLLIAAFIPANCSSSWPRVRDSNARLREQLLGRRLDLLGRGPLDLPAILVWKTQGLPNLLLDCS